MTDLTDLCKTVEGRVIHACVGYDQLSNVLFLYFCCLKIQFYVLTTFLRQDI